MFYLSQITNPWTEKQIVSEQRVQIIICIIITPHLRVRAYPGLLHLLGFFGIILYLFVLIGKGAKLFAARWEKKIESHITVEFKGGCASCDRMDTRSRNEKCKGMVVGNEYVVVEDNYYSYIHLARHRRGSRELIAAKGWGMETTRLSIRIRWGKLYAEVIVRWKGAIARGSSGCDIEGVKWRGMLRGHMTKGWACLGCIMESR